MARSADTALNLLDLATFEDQRIDFIEDGSALVARLIDGDPNTVAVFQSVNGEPVNLLFGFPNGTVAPESFHVTHSAEAGARPPARVDILASTVSASSGFSSLRTERIDPLKPDQQMHFASSAANWVMVRLYPADGAEVIALADISLGGNVGFPEVSYAFGESPAAALEIVGAMAGIGAADLKLTAEEKEIFSLAESGTLGHQEFATIALLASGVTDAGARSSYLARIDELAAAAKAAVDLDAPPEESGAKLLEWLHANALQGGYEERQTNLSDVLDQGVFNCVSSAVLFNAVAGQLGYDVRAIEVPDHAFSIIYDGINHMDVETTTAQGFNPRRDNVAKFEKLTGFQYIPQSNKSKRREIDAAGLAALIYYNHGVTHLAEGRYQEALFANFRAMSLDPVFASAATNSLAALGRWGTSLADSGNWQDAVEVAALGTRLAPEDRGLSSTQKAIWQRWAFSEADAGRPETALGILTDAAQQTGDESFSDMRSVVLTRPAEKLVASGDWRGAIEFTADAAALLDAEALSDLTEWRRTLYRRWAHAELDSEQFPRALEVLTEANQSYPGDPDVARTTRYLAQEWALATGFEEGLQAIEAVKTAMPSVQGLGEVAETYVQHHVRASIANSALEAALADVQRAARLVDAETEANLGAFVYETYARESKDVGDWASAAEIYAEGRKAFPESAILRQNARYVAQEWQRQASADGGVDALAGVQIELRTLFPEFAVDPGFGEDEIVRQINASLRDGDYASADETLASAQLLIRPETYKDLRILIFDRQAQVAMKAGEWAQAASVYYTARVHIGEPSLFSNNIAYIAQEWTRAAAAADGAAGVAGAMDELVTLFPDDKDVSGIGVQTLQRMVTEAVDSGAFDQAGTTIRDSRSFLSQEEAGSLIVTLHVRAGGNAIDESRWSDALQAYAEGLAVVPDARDLSRNIPYVLQEWSQQAIAEGGAEQLLEEIAIMQDIYPQPGTLADVLENVISREAARLVDTGAPQSALDLIGEVAPAIPDDLVANIKVMAFDRWARGSLDSGDWAEAIRIYELGLLEVPESSLLDNNRAYAESQR